MAKPNDFDIPRLFYFQSGNVFTGSRKSLNFRIEPKDDIMAVQTWHGFICSALAEIEYRNEFPLSPEGHADMLVWLQERFEAGPPNQS